MRRLAALALLAAVVAGGWAFLQRFEIRGLENIQVQPRNTSTNSGDVPAVPPVAREGGVVRLASFNIQVFGESKASNPRVMDVLAEVVRRFDLVAIQEIRAKNQALLPDFVDLVNATGREYRYILGPRLGRTSSKEQYAYVYDAASIEADSGAVYTVSDPDDLLHRPPLVGMFRVRGPPPEQAFTFTLVNIHTDPDETDTELDALGDVFVSVRNDGRNEDDIIMLGDLNVDDQHLGRLGQLSDIQAVISGVPTNTRGTKQYDNIVFQRRATTEHTGRAGVFDLMREFNLTMDEALDVSDHLPVWAEFSLYEQGITGPIATLPEAAAR